MKPSSFLRILLGAGLASACAIVPLWIGREGRPEDRRLVFVLPHDFHGAYDCEDPGALWLWQREFGTLAARADAMERVVRIRFKTRDRDAALGRLRAIPGAAFEANGTDGIVATLQDPPEDLSGFERDVRNACAFHDWSVEVHARPRIEARFVFHVLPEARRYAHTPSPAQQVERHLEQHGTPAVVLKVHVSNETTLEIRTRHGGLAVQRALAAMCPGVFDLGKSKDEPVAVDREERFVTSTLVAGNPTEIVAKLASMEGSWAEFAFAASAGEGRVTLTWVDPPDWKIVEAKVKSLTGLALTEPVETKRPRKEHRWSLAIDPSSKLPGGRPVRVDPPSPAAAVRGFLEALQRKGPLAAITSIEVVNDEHLGVSTRRPGSAFVKAVFDACPGAFDPDGVAVEQTLTLRSRRPAGDPALVVDLETTLGEARQHARSILGQATVEYWTTLRIAGSPMKAADAVAFLEKTLPAGSHGEIRIAGPEHLEIRERWTVGGVVPQLAKLAPGRFKPAGTRIVLRTPRLSYDLFEACETPLAGSRSRIQDLRWIRSKEFWLYRPEHVGNIEDALRDGRASVAILVDPPADLPSVDLQVRMILGAAVSTRIPRDVRRQLRDAISGRVDRLSWKDVRILCRRDRRVSREQAMDVAERLRACGVRASVQPEADAGFRSRLARGDFDLVVDAFHEDVRWRSSALFAGLRNDALEARRGELEETFDPRTRATLRVEIAGLLDDEAVWMTFGEVPVKICGSKDALRRLGFVVR